DEVAAAAVDRDAEDHHSQEEEPQSERCPPEQVGPLVTSEEPDPDPEERPEKQEVREVREIDDVGAGPTDQDQLGHQHEEVGRDQLDPGRAHPRDSRGSLEPCQEADTGPDPASFTARRTVSPISAGLRTTAWPRRSIASS